jgi:CRISPR-associated protein Csy1
MNDMGTEEPSMTTEGKLKAVIAAFLQERLQVKLDGLKEGEDEKRQKHLENYQPQTWIADAAKKADNVQQASHVLKFSHPDAVGSSLNSTGNPHAGEFTIGTHSLGKGQSLDVVVSTAAYLPVYAFLSLAVDDKTLLDRCIAQDKDLSAAFSDDSETAEQWMAAFARLAQPKGQPASHTLAKQIYWPLEDGGYHLLAPLFPSSLADAVWRSLGGQRDSAIAKATKAARDARRAGKPHHEGYSDYPNYAVQKFGGTQPQNVSQLNSKRQGEAYLLASLPPNWQSQGIRPLLHVDSVFSGKFSIFGGRENVRNITGKLKKFLFAVQPRNSTIDIRDERDELLAQLCDELLNYAATIHELTPCWTQNPDCRLNADEQCWLDPGRADTDSEFAAQYFRGDWKDGVSRRFGNWLNSRLEMKKIHFDQYSSDHWAKAIEREFAMIRLEISHD